MNRIAYIMRNIFITYILGRGAGNQNHLIKDAHVSIYIIMKVRFKTIL